MNKWLMAVVTVLLLTACGNTDKELTKEETVEIIEQGTVGFEMSGATIEEAADIPEKEKTWILAAFNEYMDAFNAEDIERYKATISENATGFNYEEEVVTVKEAFEQYDIQRQAEDVTIVKFSETEAQVFTNLSTEMIQIETGVEHASAGRQVTVFINEDGQWKVSSIYYIENQ